MRVLFVTLSLSNNQLGRVHSLYELARLGGHEAQIATTHPGPIWQPLADSVFASACHRVSFWRLNRLIRDWADLVITIKALPPTLLLALPLCVAAGKPILADVDDPDADAITVWADSHARAKFLIRYPHRYALFASARQAAIRLPSMVSNPVLQRHYGGPIVPHARPDLGPGDDHSSDRPRVAFVGTVREHKGIDLIRSGVASLASQGWTLVVTAPAPHDIRPWETWTGLTSWDEGMKILRESDVVVLPSKPVGYARGQLPMKLIDAMLAGRALAVSDLEVLTWAMGDTGERFTPGSLGEMVDALRRLSSPTVRSELGARARARALGLFTVPAVRPAFDEAVEAALTSGPPGSGLLRNLR